MHNLAPSIVKRRWLAVLIGSLALAVFLWGLAYKLSLYAPETSHEVKVPAARMLSENERSDSAARLFLTGSTRNAPSLLPPLHGASLSLFLGFALLCVCLPMSAKQPATCGSPCALHALPFAAMNAFFFRPPPSLS